MMRQTMLLLVLLFGSAQALLAGTYTPDNLPMPYLQDKTRHVVNPDGILSNLTVARMDSMLTALESERGVQSVVAVVESVEGGDCYEFAITLGNERGVGNSQNSGLIILLATQDRCYQILTGEGLEGTLPDAICRRIENRKMVPFLKSGEWDQAMLQTVAAVCAVVNGDTSLIGNSDDGDEDEGNGFLWIMLALFFGSFFMSLYSSRKKSTCPKCGRRPLSRIKSQITVDRLKGVEHHKVYYRCPHCGHTICRTHDEPTDNGTGFGGIPPVMGPFHRGFGGGGFSGGVHGGSFGGGRFGGGGAGGRF